MLISYVSPDVVISNSVLSLSLTTSVSTVALGQTQQEAYDALVSAMEAAEDYDLIHPQVVAIEDDCIATLDWILTTGLPLLAGYPSDQQTFSDLATAADVSLASSRAALDNVEDIYWAGGENVGLGWNSYSVADYADAVTKAGLASGYFDLAENFVITAASLFATNKSVLDILEANLKACLDGHNISY